MSKTHHLLVGVLVLAASACQSSAPKAKKEDTTVVAKVGGETITASELDKTVGPQLAEMERQFKEQQHNTRRQALEQLVQKKIFEAKAKKENLTVEQYVQKIQDELLATIPEPPADQVKSIYDQTVAQGRQLPPFDQVRPDIVKYVKSQQAQPAAMAKFEELRKEMGVEILLPAYKVEVEAKGPSKGPAKAPVTIVGFSEFQCPYCVKAEETVKEVLAAYPDKVRYVHRDFPLEFHADAPKASEAAYCAEDQGKYWEMHDRLFKAGGKDLGVEKLKAYALELSLDPAKFDKCLDSGAKKEVVDAHAEAGRALGVTGTPAFFVNGRPLPPGAQPLEVFKQVIDEELKLAGALAKK